MKKSTNQYGHKARIELPVYERIRAIQRLRPYRTSRSLLLAFASAVIMSGVMIQGGFDPKSNVLQADFHVAFVCVANLIIFTLVYVYNFWLLRCGRKDYRLVIEGLFGSMAIAALFTMLSFWVESAIYGEGHTTNSFTLNLIINMTASLIAFLISILLHDVTIQQQLVVENEHLQTENTRIRYETLERQVAPHFLFNSLNTLDGLIGFNDENAHTYLHRLADIFRYSMQEQNMVTLSDELEFTHSYVYLMQIRHGDGLIVNEHIDSSLLDSQMPHISLQLLVENAIKHNVVTSRRPLTINIETTDNGMLRVSNIKQPKTDREESTGIGLTNLMRRYQLLFNRDINILDEEHTFIVELPLI